MEADTAERDESLRSEGPPDGGHPEDGAPKDFGCSSDAFGVVKAVEWPVDGPERPDDVEDDSADPL